MQDVEKECESYQEAVGSHGLYQKELSGQEQLVVPEPQGNPREHWLHSLPILWPLCISMLPLGSHSSPRA